MITFWKQGSQCLSAPLRWVDRKIVDTVHRLQIHIASAVETPFTKTTPKGFFKKYPVAYSYTAPLFHVCKYIALRIFRGPERHIGQDTCYHL